MKKKIYATGNETIKGEYNVSYYIFEKDKEFLDWLDELLKKVFNDYYGIKAKYIVDVEKNVNYEKDIDKMIDVHEKYEKDGDRVDVFYGDKRVYATLRWNRLTREKFAKFVMETKNWVKVKEAKGPHYVKK